MSARANFSIKDLCRYQQITKRTRLEKCYSEIILRNIALSMRAILWLLHGLTFIPIIYISLLSFFHSSCIIPRPYSAQTKNFTNPI